MSFAGRSGGPGGAVIRKAAHGSWGCRAGLHLQNAQPQPQPWFIPISGSESPPALPCLSVLPSSFIFMMHPGAAGDIGAFIGRLPWGHPITLFPIPKLCALFPASALKTT